MKQFYLLLIILFLPFISSGQVAIGGTSDNFDSVYWLTWDNNNLEDDAWTGNLENKEYTWNYDDDIRIKATVTDLSTDRGHVAAYTPGTWRGDGLGCMYSRNEEGECSQGVLNSGLVTSADGATVKFSIGIKLQFKIEGEWRDVPYPGMVIADAEEMNGDGEYISAEIMNSGADTQWQLIDKRESESPEDYWVTFSKDDKGTQKVRFEAVDLEIGNQAVLFARGANGLGNVTMKGGGKSALALGFVLPFDVGNTEGYCEVRHYIDDFTPVNTKYKKENKLGEMDRTELNPEATVYIGPSDDKLGKNSIAPDDLQINFTQNIISIEVQVTNEKEEPATLYWWMDFNNDKIFTSDELKIFENIAPGESSEWVRLEFTEEDFPGEFIGKNLRVGDLHSRLRITTTVLQDLEGTDQDDRSCAIAMDGEVEDYVFDVRGISISGEVLIDADGLMDGLVDNEFEGVTLDFGAQLNDPLFAYLLRDEDQSIAGKTSVLPDGSYTITNMNHGSYTLALSYHDYTVDEIFPLGSENHLPSRWQSVGETLGIINDDEGSSAENVLDDEVDGRVPIETPAAGWDIIQVNFGLNQPPELSDLNYTIEAYGFIEAPVLDTENAVDHQGNESIVPESLRLFDGDGNPRTTVVMEGIGTFTITDGFDILFSPLRDFHGSSVSIEFVVEDAAELVSLPGLLTIEVEQPQFIMVNPVLPSKLRG